MKKHRTNIEGLCDALNAMGIRTTILGRSEAKRNEEHTGHSVEQAHRKALEEIARIAGNAKRRTRK